MDDADEFYLGDGLYVSLSQYDIKLRAPRLTGDHEVFLDAPMLQALVDWARKQGVVVS